MTVSIFQALAMLPDGAPGIPIAVEEMGHVLRAQVDTEAERQRNSRHALRDELYRDGGDAFMTSFLAEVFDDPLVLRKRRALVPFTKFSNSLKRIVGEMSTVYAEPAKRTVGGSEDNQARYAAVVEELVLDEQMDVVNQLLNLHRALFIGPRVRVNADGTSEVVLDIATPAQARVVVSPVDRTKILGVLIRVDMPMVRSPWQQRPAWQLWTDHETMFLDDRFNVVDGTIVEHGIGVNRWIPISYSAATLPGFWPGEDGQDLVAARMTEWLADVLMVKETKSNKKVPIVSGDATEMARNQAADSEVPIQAPEGVSVTTVDMGTDPAPFIATSDHALQRTGSNHGLSMGALTHQGVQSAEARELMLAPVRERRRKQIKIFRRVERALAVVLSAVLRRYDPARAFDVEGWKIDFGETQVTMSKRERLEIFERERAAGLTSTLRFKLAENPDLSPDEAMAEMIDDIGNETLRNVLMRPLQQISGSMAAPVPDAATSKPAPPAAPPDADDEPDLSWVKEALRGSA